MIGIRRGARVLRLALLGTLALALGAPGLARAQSTTGKIVGRVVDKDSGQTMAGVTVIVQGPQGEDAALTDWRGDYFFSTLPIGTYLVRFYVAGASPTERPDVRVVADRTVRVNAHVAGREAAAAAVETYLINKKAPMIDIGSTRLGATFDGNVGQNLPVAGANFSELINRAPGAFTDRTGSVSIAGATGLENQYVVNGLNVTGTEYGNINTNSPTLGGGTNLPLEFIDQMSVSSGGYSAEFGGAMGGVITAVTKSGTNQLHGSATASWAPSFLSGSPRVVDQLGNSISAVRKPGFDTRLALEVGGPIVRDKLFYWVGFAPSLQETHVYRYTHTLLQNTDGSLSFGPLVDTKTMNEPSQSYSYGGKIDYVPQRNHRLTLSLMGSPSTSTNMRAFEGAEAISNFAWAREKQTRDTTDISARWLSQLYDGHWQIEVNAGLHKEHYDDRSPDAALNALNQQEWWGANLYDLEGIEACKPLANGFEPCPVNNYHNGGFGLIKTYDAYRWMGEVKSTHLFDLGGHHEVKYGWHVELTLFDQDRFYSGEPGSRALIQHNPQTDPGRIDVYNFFTLRPGERPDEYTTHPWDLASVDPTTGRYVDHLAANVKSLSNAFFLQDSYSIFPNLTLNAGARMEMQKMYDFRDQPFLSLDNLGPRVGLIWDPSKDGRSKVFVHYGRYFEAIPMNLAARYFGGEGINVQSVDPATCPAGTDPSKWTGNGEWRQCTSSTNAANYFYANNGTSYPVQPHLQGQFHDEVVAGVEHQLTDDMVVGLNYTHRWLGAIIEDGTGDGSTTILANPGAVPQSALDEEQRDVDQAQARVNQLASSTDAAAVAAAQSALTGAQVKLNNLKALAADPKPERTFDAITLFVDKRFARHWFTHAQYTYSRLFGNYEGLYQDHRDYFAPNGSAAYDLPDITLNQKGPLPNDRPHSGRVDAYYQWAAGKGTFLAGLSFSGHSGQPRNYVSGLGIYGQYVNLLPRGAAGRTPPVTQFDGKLAYRRPLTPNTGLEAFVDLFNILNQQAVIRMDDNYTYDSAAAIVNGSPEDLKYAKNADTGAPLNKNPNFGRPVAYQAPFSARMGLRLTF
jgi:hypothetical protein